MKKCSVLAIVLVLLASRTATASTELNGLFDARSMGMGGTGVAYLDSAGAIPINPAALDQIGKLSLSLNGFLFISQPEAPYRVTHIDDAGATYDNYETIRTPTIFAPLFFLGGAYRLFDRVVVGAGVYPLVGMGTRATYRPAPELNPDLQIKNEAALVMLEAGEAVSVRVTKTLSLALMWRITYMQQTSTTALPGRAVGGTLLDASGNPIYANLDVTGVNFSGIQAGLLWKPDPSLRLGFSYRSKITVDGEGTTKTKNPVDGSPIALKTLAPFSSPHSFRAGIALTVLNDKLTFATDVKYLMFAEAFKTIDTTVVRNGMPSTTKTPAHWKNAYNVHLGTEYRVAERVALRGGYILATSATSEVYAKAFMAPPGVSHCWTAGIGFKALDRLDVDLAGSYVVLESKIDVATPHNAGIGIYASHTGELSLSATFHM